MSDSAGFELHPRLAADCHLLGRVGSIQVLLHRNGSLPWFILVPRGHAAELFELEPDLRRELDELADQLGRFLLEVEDFDKLNVGAIGNIVPQLHYHLIGRLRDDPAWPGVVWGRLPDAPARSEAEIAALQARLAEAGIVIEQDGAA